MANGKLVLVLGDQLSTSNPALNAATPGQDTIVMAEVAEETTYVPHNRHKIALIFSAMRHFRDQLREQGFEVIYYPLSAGHQHLESAVAEAISQTAPTELLVCEPGEHRVAKMIDLWETRLGVAVRVLDDTRFLASRVFFTDWLQRQKQPRMEYFYREMRKHYQILLDVEGKPEGGRWNYDRDNRKGWRGGVDIPKRAYPAPDAITREVIREVTAAFPENPGDLERFYCATTAAEAQAQLDWFCQHALKDFGTWQDAMATESEWLFHSLISMYLNIGLLDPLTTCRQVEQAWRDGHCELAAAEGFIRQVLGWREYVRGIYWAAMPDYATRNALQAHRSLPHWFWSGDTDMHCLHLAITQSLDLGYGHHIQRLMVIGNFALLAGLSVKEVCDWYLAVYVDAFEWVELPNTLGMALHADEGFMASKPYAASGKYIQRQGNYCKSCRYDPAKVTGPGACPYNALYWSFLDRNREHFADNHRMKMMYGNWDRKSQSEQAAILQWADQALEEALN